MFLTEPASVEHDATAATASSAPTGEVAQPAINDIKAAEVC